VALPEALPSTKFEFATGWRIDGTCPQAAGFDRAFAEISCSNESYQPPTWARDSIGACRWQRGWVARGWNRPLPNRYCGFRVVEKVGTERFTPDCHVNRFRQLDVRDACTRKHFRGKWPAKRCTIFLTNWTA